ncbi:hypothetical protein [Pseudoalteromonas ruthenica]|uniref:hypothetical protein n=1 Tax=Pseudoalteromonas ruthenica TaxID=151081 RepID=UPI00241CE094|nr:hypothetical protein [Pseudoalteromonas ruthenica]|tara:strand:+ start:57812 stop:58423 length:612 start_codon:yes stop_codon:yes gene_type:complete
MKIFQEEPILKAGFTYRELGALIVAIFFVTPILIAFSIGLIRIFFETISLLIMVNKGELLFLKENGQSLGMVFFFTTMAAYIFLSLPALINKRFNKKIIFFSCIFGGLSLLIGIITTPISSFLVESYIEKRGYTRCDYYSGRGFNPMDYYVFDSKYCVSAVSVLKSEAFPWFEEMNKKGEVDYDEFLLKVEQWKAESPFFKDE